MDLEEARAFARRNHHAVLATRSRDGGVQQSPVLVGVDEEGRFTVSSRESAYKTRNLRRDTWAQLLVLTDAFFGQWVLVEGHADVLSLPEAMEPLVDYYRQVAGEHEDWDDYRNSMRRDKRVMIQVHAERAGPDRHG
jgi:PPOX class probable F420-dependent enzyme